MALIISREDFEKAITASIKTGEYPFADKLLSQWLKKYPNDIKAEFHLAMIQINNRKLAKGMEIFETILGRDPENIDCIKYLQKIDKKTRKFYSSANYVFTGEAESVESIYPWATTLRAIRKERRKRNVKHAEKLLIRAIAEAPENILIALEHAKLFSLVKDKETVRRILDLYSQRWPDCIQFKILRALHALELHKESEAVALLHACARKDPGGIVARRMLGSDHEFLSIFPPFQEITYEGEIPQGIAISFKWTKLSAGQRKEKKGTDGAELHQEEYPKISTFSPIPAQSNTTEKIYVVLSSFSGLKRKYGPKTAEVIVSNMHLLSKALGKNPHWKPIVFLPDRADCMENIGLQTIDLVDPWKIKLALMDLQTLVKKSHQAIGAVLIIGNHDVVPFHRLPNPAEDSDEHVLSDNPYATSTGNYLLPEWIVGRLPGEIGGDPGLLLEQLRHITQFHSQAQHSKGLIEQLKQFKRRLQNIGRFLREILAPPNDFGYSAEVWRRSSIAAFRPIGKGADLRVSPPYDSETIDAEKLLQSKCAYFNLHGLSTTNEWYGQKDFSESPSGPDFPVAINADNIKNITNNIDLAFTEACYGGYILDKTIDESIALKLLSVGSQGVVGSSCISYGSIFTPLIGGDLLAFIFWKYIKDGYSFGSALRQAKIGLIKVMMQRQGYLDGEDQKTVLSFNLYGDPLGCLEEIIFLEQNGQAGFSESDVLLMNDADGISQSGVKEPQPITKDIEEMLASYLPGLENAKMRVKKQKIRLAKIIEGSESEITGSNLDYKTITQIVYEKKISVRNQDHLQYARLTVDEHGKVIKLAMSR